MDLKSISEYQKKSYGEVVKMYLTEAWYFDKWYEKLILWIMGVLCLWKIFEIIF